MRRIVLGLFLLTVAGAKAEGQVAYSDVVYWGCMPTDPLSCGELKFIFAAENNMWIIDPPETLRGGDWFYHVRDDMWSFQFEDCVVPAPHWTVIGTSCATPYRYKGTWHGVAHITDRETGETIGAELVAFSAVAPEPATMILVGSGLAGIAAAVRRRRKVSRET